MSDAGDAAHRHVDHDDGLKAQAWSEQTPRLNASRIRHCIDISA